MGNFTFSEIITIIIVILIVFGPQRLPEIARKAGALASKARAAVDSIKTELDAEYGEVIQPLREARNEMRSAGAEVRGQITAFGKEIEETSKGVKQAAEDTVKEPVQGLKAAADKAINQVAAANAFPPPQDPAPANGELNDQESESEPEAGPSNERSQAADPAPTPEIDSG